MKTLEFFLKCMGKMVGARAGAEIFDKLEPEAEPEPHKNGPDFWEPALPKRAHGVDALSVFAKILQRFALVNISTQTVHS
jgi:hypothetical protein